MRGRLVEERSQILSGARLCRASKAFKRGWMDSKGDDNIIRVLGLLFKVIIQATEWNTYLKGRQEQINQQGGYCHIPGRK